MRVFNRRTVLDFIEKHSDARQPMLAWYAELEKASWTSPTEIKDAYASASFLAGDRVVFNIKGNSYRIIVHVKYGPLFLVFIRFIGTHAEYDEIDATTV